MTPRGWTRSWTKSERRPLCRVPVCPDKWRELATSELGGPPVEQHGHLLDDWREETS